MGCGASAKYEDPERKPGSQEEAAPVQKGPRKSFLARLGAAEKASAEKEDAAEKAAAEKAATEKADKIEAEKAAQAAAEKAAADKAAAEKAAAEREQAAVEELEVKRRVAEEESKRGAEEEKIELNRSKSLSLEAYKNAQVERELRAASGKNEKIEDLQMGAKISVMSHAMERRCCTVVGTDLRHHKVKVHYDGLGEDHDEWMEESSDRILGMLENEKGNIGFIVQAAAAFADVFRENIARVIEECEEVSEETAAEVTDQIFKDFKVAAQGEHDCDGFACSLTEANDDVDADCLEAAKALFTAIQEFINEARPPMTKTKSLPAKCCSLQSGSSWISNFTDDEAVCSIVDALNVTLSKFKETSDFSREFQLSLESKAKSRGRISDEQGP